MPVIIDGKTYYRTSDVCQTVGIGRSTLFRWVKKGIINEAKHRDRRGWRLFTDNEIDRLKEEANQLSRRKD